MAYEPFELESGTSVIAGAGGDPDPSNGAIDTSGAPSFLGGTGNDSGSGGADAGGDNFTFDPERHLGRDRTNADGSYRLKRKRKGGSNSNSAAPRSRTKADNQASVDGLARVLTILHFGIANATKTPEIEIDEGDAINLAKATSQVLIEFDIKPDPKIEAIIGLVTAAGLIYGPMAVSIKMRKDAERRQKLQAQREQQVY